MWPRFDTICSFIYVAALSFIYDTARTSPAHAIALDTQHVQATPAQNAIELDTQHVQAMLAQNAIALHTQHVQATPAQNAIRRYTCRPCLRKTRPSDKGRMTQRWET